MVKVCSLTNYSKEKEQQYSEHFSKFKYPLHIFQKYAIEGLIEGQNVLVTAPTGSGKSLPAEFAVDFFYSLGKKTIYCSPIKSLSNQKFYDFTQKYPHISIGLITGDIKCNPDADVLIMTTEILLNKLYQIKQTNDITLTRGVQSSPLSTSFEMNIETELGCVVFDEIHMISNESRGFVWENSIMLLPRHIQILGLSATLDNPEKFAYWLENRGEQPVTNNSNNGNNSNNSNNSNNGNKIVYLTSKRDRAVPLIHYTFTTVNQGIFKAIKDKSVQEEIKAAIGKPFVIMDAKGKYNEEHYYKVTKLVQLFQSKRVFVKRSHVLNEVTKYLTENQMTPAICYVFSIKTLEMSAKEITSDLLEFDSKIPYTVDKECEQILRSKLANFQEYLLLPEYINLISLLQKGIATHHSKMLPVLREIVEILFARGYIKLLFATESVAIGLNLPVKTCIFTDIYKHDSSNLRILQGHEYVQAAGRAGRLGLDTIGHVIHLPNLYRNMEPISFRNMLQGSPQTLSSKFKISYNLLLNLIDSGDISVLSFAKRSMITNELDSEMGELYARLGALNSELDNIYNGFTHLKTRRPILEEYSELLRNHNMAVNKKRKEIERKIAAMRDQWHTIDKDLAYFEKCLLKEKQRDQLEMNFDNVNKYLSNSIDIIVKNLLEHRFLEEDSNGKNILTLKGKYGKHLRETHCLVFSQFIQNKFENENVSIIDTMTARELISVFSCFTNIKVAEDFSEKYPSNNSSIVVKKILQEVKNLYTEYQNFEFDNNINTGVDYTLHYDLLEFVEEWTLCTTPEHCQAVLNRLKEEKGIFLGEFVKALLKINNISLELEKIAEMNQNVPLLHKLRQIPELTLKYVVTNQSLYV